MGIHICPPSVDVYTHGSTPRNVLIQHIDIERLTCVNAPLNLSVVPCCVDSAPLSSVSLLARSIGLEARPTPAPTNGKQEGMDNKTGLQRGKQNKNIFHFHTTTRMFAYAHACVWIQPHHHRHPCFVYLSYSPLLHAPSPSNSAPRSAISPNDLKSVSTSRYSSYATQ